MTLALVAVVVGLALLVWSGDRLVDGCVAAARHFRLPPLLIGMVIVGFGTSAPEMVVSAVAASQGNPGIALGNAYGSNIANIALVLGVTALVKPLVVQSQVLRANLPILTAVTVLAAWQLWDGAVSWADALVLLATFAAVMGRAMWSGLRKRGDPLEREFEAELELRAMSVGRATLYILVGLVVLILSSRILVWGAVGLARGFGVSDLIVGLTIIALGTSLPELASSTIASRKGEQDIAVGNVLGSNLFNTLAVVGIAGVIHPIAAGPEVLFRDIPVMGALTLSLFFLGYGLRGPGRINRLEGAGLLACYAGYMAYLAATHL